MKRRLWAFWMGMREFRSDFTLNLDEEGLREEYDWGREWAHRLTFRRYDHAYYE
jgi:hypothetical protein